MLKTYCVQDLLEVGMDVGGQCLDEFMLWCNYSSDETFHKNL